MKLGTHVPRNNMHACNKLHNYGFNTYSVMPLFRLRKKQKLVVVGYVAILLSDTFLRVIFFENIEEQNCLT